MVGLKGRQDTLASDCDLRATYLMSCPFMTCNCSCEYLLACVALDTPTCESTICMLSNQVSWYYAMEIGFMRSAQYLLRAPHAVSETSSLV